MNAAHRALRRAEWQPFLFGTPNRALLAECVPEWNCRTLRVRVHRNHGIEAVTSACRPYAAWNLLAFDWHIGGYDDSLSFDVSGDADVEVVWLDTTRLRAFADDRAGLATWLGERLRALRSLTSNPIVTLAWPLTDSDRATLESADIPASHVVDLDALADSLGECWLDERAEPISGTRLSNQACLRVARELACCWLPAAVLPPRKAIAVDLDGTLYEGALGEDGATAVALTDGHQALHRHLGELRARGVLLALVSRNEREDVENLFSERKDFPLRLADFAAVEVSWDDKSQALRRVAEALRIACDAIVFVDDNAGELAEVAGDLPVATVHAGQDVRVTASAVGHVAGIFRWRISNEDALRSDDLAAAAARAAIETSSRSADEYFRSLAVRLQIFVGTRRHLARMAELSTKTNQFNLSLSRMRESEIAQRLERRAASVVAIALSDRLSDSGIVGLVVGDFDGQTLRVEEVCVSCRALGRRLEDTMLTHALRVMAGDHMPQTVAFSVRKGPRNEPARRWLARYTAISLDEDSEVIEVPFGTVADRELCRDVHLEICR